MNTAYFLQLKCWSFKEPKIGDIMVNLLMDKDSSVKELNTKLCCVTRFFVCLADERTLFVDIPTKTHIH